MQKYIYLLKKAREDDSPFLLKLDGFKQQISRLRLKYDPEVRHLVDAPSASQLGRFYEIMRNDTEVVDLVQSIAKSVACEVGADLIQEGFSIRCVPQNARSVEYHIDRFSGHPQYICNVWIPLSDISEDNCLRLLAPRDSKQLLEALRRTEDIDAFEAEADDLSRAVILNDEVLLFSNAFVHGTRVHRLPRLSIDFRLAWLSSFNDTSRRLGVDYKFLQPPELKIEEGALEGLFFNFLIFQANDAHAATHKFQREVIKCWEKENSTMVALEGTEYHGYKNFMQLKQWLVHTNRPIVVFSESIFKQNGAWIAEARELMLSYPRRVYSALDKVWL